MTTLQTNVTLLLVEVPDEATKFSTHLNNLIWSTDDTPHAGHNIELPSGQWEFIATTDSITEEQAKGIVEHEICDDRFPEQIRNKIRYRNYPFPIDNCGLMDALQSFRSLLRANNITTRHAVLKLK